jgi:hypothetical protein
LYKPFEHHHEVKAVVVASNVFAFHTPPVGVAPVASVIVVAKAAHVILMFLAAVATANVDYAGVTTLASISVGDEQQVP